MNKKELEFYREFELLVHSMEVKEELITKHEIDALYDLIRKEIINIDTEGEDYNEEEQFYTEFEFENLNQANMDVISAFHKFIKFMKDNKFGISGKLKKSMIQVAIKLTMMSNMPNKSSARNIINELKTALNNIH